MKRIDSNYKPFLANPLLINEGVMHRREVFWVIAIEESGDQVDREISGSGGAASILR